MNAFTVLCLILGASVLAVAAVLGPWYLEYKIREWGTRA